MIEIVRLNWLPAYVTVSQCDWWWPWLQQYDGDDDDLNLYTIFKTSTPRKFAYFWQIERDKVNKIFLVTFFCRRRPWYLSSLLMEETTTPTIDDDSRERRRLKRRGASRVGCIYRIQQRRRRPRLRWWWCCGGEQIAVMMTITSQFLWTKMLTFVDLRV